VERQALLVERLDSLHYNQVGGQLMKSYFVDGEMRENHVNGNVRIIYYPLEKDSLILYQNYTEAPKMRTYLQKRKLKRVWAGPEPTGCTYPIGAAPREHCFLESFAWFDYIRPRDKHDLFEWRPKHAGAELKPSVRRNAPLQTLD
jgi:hypothetical protein